MKKSDKNIMPRFQNEVGGPYVAFIHYRKDHAPNAILIRSEAAATTLRSMYTMITEKYTADLI